jgi:hypothetical protein
MKITRNHLKELIKQSVAEAEDWWSKLEPDEKDAYIKAHPKSKKAQDRQRAADDEADDMKWDDAQSSRDAEDAEDSGGPSYSDVPKGAKSTKQAKLMKKNDSAAEDVGYKNTDDLIKNGNAYEVEEWMNNVPDVGQDFDQAAELLDLVRDNDQGMRDDDDDVIDDYLNKVKKIVNTPGGRGEKGSGKSNKETGDEMMSAADAANAKMDAAEKEDTMQQPFYKISYTDSEGREKTDSMRAKTPGEAKKDFINMNKGRGFKVVKVQKESIRESIRKFTVKEVRKWMKTLEENRYKKVYNSDARRVAWLANNNLSEDYESMPISMRKKWSKAAYGRERYLANEFLQSQKLREAIRKELKKQIRG